MAKIEWTDDAKLTFKTYLKNAQLEFGTSTARKWQTERKSIEWRLERYPVSYPKKIFFEEEVCSIDYAI